MSSTETARCSLSARGTPAPSSAKGADSVDGVGTCESKEQAAGRCLVQWLLAVLAHERLETDAAHAPLDLAWRRGWNARAESIERELRVRIGLAELAACDVGGDA